MEKKKIVVATNNEGKLKEIKKIFNDYELLSLKDINCQIEVEEDQETIEGNSLKKAKEISQIVKMPCIADDTGLCIEAFAGWPGVYTARFLGENATPKQKNQAILDKMKNLQGEERKAKFVCVVTYFENGQAIVGKGVVEGRIATEPRGNNGFGYDPIFELENGKTYAEMLEVEKNSLSHRKLALENLRKQLTTK